MRRNRFVVILPLALASMLLAAALWSLNGIAATRAESLLAPGKSPGPALSIAKIASAESITPAGQLIYVLVITNTGDVSATNVVVTDTLPDGLTLSASEPPAATQSGSTATWEFQEIAPGEKATVILTTTVSAPLPDGLPLVNIAAAVCDETLPVESDPVTVTVLAPAFALSKQPYTPTVRPGDWLTYTFRLTNTGHLTLTEPYTLLERLPAHTGYVTSTPPAEITEGLLLFTFASPLPPGETTEATLVLSVTEPLTHGWHLVNEEYFAFSPAVTPSVSGPAVTITVESAALEIGKFASPSPVPPGSLLTYTIAVSNTGDARGAAVQLILTDTWPGFTTFVSCAGGQACGADQVEGWVTWTLDVLPPNVTGWFTLTVNVSEGLVAGWWLTNQVTLTAQSVAPLTATAAVSVAHVPGVSLAPNGEASILPGETITYNHTLTNTGNGEDTFTITLGGLPAGWGGNVEPTSVSLGAGASAPVTVTVEVPTDALSGTVATAVVTATSSADPSVWATVTDRTTVRHRPGVALAPDGEGEVLPGETVTYTHILTNTGNGEDTFTITLGGLPAGWSGSVEPTSVLLGAGASAPVTVTVGVPADALSGTVATAVVTATSSADPSVWATVTDRTTVRHRPGVALAPDGEGEALPGETVTYTHILTNTGNGEDTFTITLGGLPAGWSGSVEPTSVSLGAGASAPVTVTVEVPADALSGTVATAVVTATSSADSSVWATVTDRTTVRHRPGVALAPNWERAAFSGDIVTYTHILTNTGNGEDVFYLQLSSSLGQAALVPTTTYTLSPGVAITFYVQLTIPGVLSDQTGFTIITATSRGGAGPAVVTDTTFVKPYRIFLPVAIRNYPPAWARLTSFPQELTVYSLGICGQYMYAGTQQGVYVSTDGGRSWSQRLPGNVVRGVAVHPTICTLAYATTWGNYVYKTRDGGSTWTQLSSGLGGSQWSYALAFSRDGQRIYLGTGNKGVYQATVRTSSDNEQWTRVLNMDNAVPGLTVTSTATAQYVVYAAVWEAGVYWFNGTQWSAWSQQPSDRKVLKVAANPVNGMLFAGTNEKFFRWTGSDWASLTPSARTFDFAFHPPLNRIYAAQEGNGVLVSTDGGLNWTPMNTGMVPLPSQIRCLVVHEGYLYAGTTSGIWRYPLVP